MSSHDYGTHTHPHSHGGAEALYSVGPAPQGRMGKVLMAWGLVSLVLIIAATVIISSLLMSQYSFFGSAAVAK